jgi:hypothetical protein
MRLSLHRRLVALRRTYTGEYDSTVMPAAHAILHKLDTAQREHLWTMLDSQYGTRLLGAPEPLADPAIRAMVVPDATTHRQRELEAGVFLALRHVHPLVGHGHGLPQGALCRRVYPTHDGQALALSPHTLAAVLAELLPREQDGDLHGLAGLRVRLHRRDVQLYLADTEPAATVVLPSISKREFTAALAFATTLTGAPTPSLDEPAPLSEAERLAITLGTVPGPLALESAVLRRFGLFRDTDWTTIELVGLSCLRIDWAGGPTPALIAQQLTHPMAGLPDDVFTTTSIPDGTVVLGCTGLGAVLTLRQHTAIPAQPRADVAWQAFTSAINRSKPTSPK